jgi:hypothetical protein
MLLLPSITNPRSTILNPLIRFSFRFQKTNILPSEAAFRLQSTIINQQSTIPNPQSQIPPFVPRKMRKK